MYVYVCYIYWKKQTFNDYKSIIVTNYKCVWLHPMLLMHSFPSSTQLNNGAGAEDSDSDEFYKPKRKHKHSLRRTGDI